MSKNIEIDHKEIVYEILNAAPVGIQRDIVYKTVGDTELKLDVYVPASLPSDVRRPGILFIHGGPIQRVERQLHVKNGGQYRSWGKLAAASGLIGIPFSHRYHSYQALEQSVDDVLAAIEYVRHHADSLNVDPQRLCLWTCSGGGPLLSFALREQPQFVRCMVAYYPFMDLREITPASELLDASVLHRHSPVVCLSENSQQKIPILLVRAGLDRPQLNQSVDRFVQEAFLHNAPLEVINYPEGRHAFDILDDNATSRRIIARTIDFIRYHLEK